MDYLIVASLALAAVVALFLYALAIGTKLMLQDEGRLRLHAMLRRHGVDPARSVAIEPYGAALATRRCATCPEEKRCDAWLASPSGGDIEAFCPNAGFVHRMATR